MDKVKQPILLSEFIFQVKQDLLDKQFSAEDPVPLFAIDEIEIEVGVTATREAEGNTGLNLTIFGIGLEAGGTGTVGKENAQTVRIKLTPLLTKEEWLSTLSPEQLQRIKAKSGEVLTRGEQVRELDAA